MICHVTNNLPSTLAYFSFFFRLNYASLYIYFETLSTFEITQLTTDTLTGLICEYLEKQGQDFFTNGLADILNVPKPYKISTNFAKNEISRGAEPPPHPF